jgi:hypothetical protein
LLIELLLNDGKIDFELASVSRWRAEEVKHGGETILGTKLARNAAANC